MIPTATYDNLSIIRENISGFIIIQFIFSGGSSSPPPSDSVLFLLFFGEEIGRLCFILSIDDFFY